jgi:hypothetical protein
MTRINNSSLIGVNRINPSLEEDDSPLQVLAVTAHVAQNSDAGKAIWQQLQDNVPELKDLSNTDDAETIRREVRHAEAGAGPDLSSTRALQVATHSWQAAWRFRDERLRQARISFTVTLICIVIGLIILTSGIVASLAGAAFHVATYVSAVGVFVEFLGAVLLWVHRAATRRLDLEAAVAHELERIRLGVAVACEIGNTQLRERALRSLVKNVRDHGTTMLDDALPSSLKERQHGT